MSCKNTDLLFFDLKFLGFLAFQNKIFCVCVLQPLNNVHEDKMSSTKMDNGPVDFTKEPGNQGLTKKTKLDQDTRLVVQFNVINSQMQYCHKIAIDITGCGFGN